MKKRAVVLLSGGLDSTVTLHQALSAGYECHALTVNYNQRHSVELDAAKKVANCLAVADHRLIDLDLSAFGGSSLTAGGDVPKGKVPAANDEIPSTYVPARNTVFLSLALSWAEALGARDIFIGVSAVDYSGYPDCRPEFIAQFIKLANLGTKAGDTGEQFNVHTPLIHLSKAETIQLGARLGVDFGKTHSCYDPSAAGKPCGQCDSCLLRRKGFQEAGMDDPVVADD